MMSWWGYQPFEMLEDSPREGGAQTEAQKQETSILVDASFLSRPEILREGFELFKEKRDFLPGKRARSVNITSLTELEIKTEYFTDNGTLLVRVTQDIVWLGNRIKIPVPQDVHLQILVATSKPSLSGVLSLPVFQVALENFTKQRVEDGFGFNIQIGDKIQDNIVVFRKLDFLETRCVYFTPDRYLRVKRKIGGDFKFSFDVMRMMAARPIPTDFQTFGNGALRSSQGHHSSAAPSSGGYYKSAKIGNRNDENNCQQRPNQPTMLEEIAKPHITRRNLPRTPRRTTKGGPESLTSPPPPPPPPGGPPPAPSFSASGSLIKEPPKKKLRVLRWQTIPNKDVGETFWNSSNSSDMLTTSQGKVALDKDEIENLFSVSPSRPKKGKDGKKKKVEEMNVSVLGLRRANNIGLLLAGYKKTFPTPEDISNAIRNADFDKLTSQHLESLCSLMPITHVEREDLGEVLLRKKKEEEATEKGKESEEGEKKKKKSLIPPSDLFLADLMTIPRLETKLSILYFLSKFPSLQKDVNELASPLSSATSEVRHSKKLFPILHLILELGKVLNQYSYQRNASGFRLCTLLKLSEVKMTDRKKTLLHYVVQNVQTKMPRNLLTEEDMPSLQVASTFGMKDVRTLMRDLGRGFEEIAKELEWASQEEKDGGKFHEVVRCFVERTAADWKEMNQKVRKVEEDFEELAKYVGEQSTIDSQELFSIVHQFHRLFLMTVVDLKRQARLREKKEIETEKGLMKTKMDMHKELMEKAAELMAGKNGKEEVDSEEGNSEKGEQ